MEVRIGEVPTVAPKNDAIGTIQWLRKSVGATKIGVSALGARVPS